MATYGLAQRRAAGLTEITRRNFKRAPARIATASSASELKRWPRSGGAEGMSDVLSGHPAKVGV